MQYSTETTVKAPIGLVKNWLRDSQYFPEWQEGLLSYELSSGEPNQPGSIYDIVFETRGRRMEMTETIIESKRENEFILYYESKSVHNRIEMKVESLAPEKTLIHQTNTFEFNGLFMKLMGWLMPSLFKKQSLKYMRAFKQFAEEKYQKEKVS